MTETDVLENHANENNITALIRVVSRISDQTFRSITLMSSFVNEIVILFSGKRDQFNTAREITRKFSNTNIWWVYSFGYMEPIIKLVSTYIKNPWMMIFTERDVPSQEFLRSLNSFTSSGLDGYLCVRKMETTYRENIPKWLAEYTKDGFKRSFQAYLYRKDKVFISDFIHSPFRVSGKTVKLNPRIFFVERVFSANEMKDDKSYTRDWVEKEKRYIFVDLFQRRMSRAAALMKVLENVPLLRRLNFHNFCGKFFSRELTHFEYIAYELIRSFAMGKIGLTPYQKVAIRTIRDCKSYGKFGFMLSEHLRSLKESLVDFMQMPSVFVDESLAEFSDLIDPQNSHEAFVKHLLKRFLVSSPEWRGVNANEIVKEVQYFLKRNLERFMPL